MNNRVINVYQFTGKKDINGTDIYEGDIIKGMFDFGFGASEETATVYFNDECGYQWNYWYTSTLEVIGNEYENKELIRGERYGNKRSY